MRIPKIVLIGCGTVAMRYYVPALRRHPGLAGNMYLADTEPENARAVQAELGGGRVVRDYREAFGDAEGAIILLPNHLHHPVAMECVEAGLHVLCEKPLAVLPEHAREMIRAAREKNLALCVNNTRRMFPSFRAVREAIDSGRLGRLAGIEYTEGAAFGWPSATGFYVDPKVSSRGVLQDLGAHVIDTICWWAGGRPEVEEMLDDSYGGPESVVKIRARKDGCEIRITLNRLCELSSAYRVRGEKACIEGSVFDWKTIGVTDASGDRTERRLACTVRNYPGFVIPIVENFVDVLRYRALPLVSGSDVLPSLEFIHECYGRRKRLDLSWDRGITIASGGGEDRGPVMERRVLVTGATGFIGGRIMEMAHLSQHHSCRVLGGLRRWASAARLGRLPVETVPLDLMDTQQIERALENVTHIIHCAKGTPEETVTGTRNLLEASLKKKVRHFIHLSTADVYGEASGVVDESSPYQYTGNTYNRMKIDAEKACWEYWEKGLPITIFRPSIVYGPFSAGWCLRFATMFLAREWGVFDTYGEGTCNLVYVDDLVRVVFDALDRQDAWGKAFNINGPELITWNEYFTRLNSLMGLPPLRIIKPGRAGASTFAMAPVRALGGYVKKHFFRPVKLIAEHVAIADSLVRSLEHRAKITPSPDELKLFARKVVYSDARARSTLSRCPDTRIDDGMSATLEWIKYLGLGNGVKETGAETGSGRNGVRS